jgi:hypothetical protein
MFETLDFGELPWIENPPRDTLEIKIELDISDTRFKAKYVPKAWPEFSIEKTYPNTRGYSVEQVISKEIADFAREHGWKSAGNIVQGYTV